MQRTFIFRLSHANFFAIVSLEDASNMMQAKKGIMQNGIYTIKNTETNEHRTFKIKVCRFGALKGKQIAELLTGPDNESDYQGFAFINDSGIQVWKSKAQKTYLAYAALLEHLLKIKTHNFSNDRYALSVSKRCMVCNRTLTTPESIERGIGPECEKKGM